MVLRITTAALLLGVLQCIEGYKRVIIVNETVALNGFVHGSDSASSSPCCKHGSCPCPSFYSALVTLTDNIMINVTSDVELAKIISLFDLANVAIVGHNQPTVNCKNTGGLNFTSCYNCVIEGITWKGCGARSIRNMNYPVLKLFSSFNITIMNCSFLYSLGQAIVLSEVSGAVYINHCDFLSNKQYKAHGSAIHYSSNDLLIDAPVNFIIANCNFLYNEGAESVVYFGQSANMYECLYLQDSKFHHNKGVPIYLTNQNIFISGNIDFYENVAEFGGGIFVGNYSSVVFHKSAMVNFTENTANIDGGAIYMINHSNILFKEHPTFYQCQRSIHNQDILDNQAFKRSFILFHDNRAAGFGQNIYAYNSNITIGNAITVTFSCKHYRVLNTSSMHISHYSTVTFEGTSKTMCTNFLAYRFSNGGAMYVNDSCAVIFKGHAKVVFIFNIAYKGSGGALYVGYKSAIIFKENSSTVFVKNIGYYSNGGAMYISNSAITFEGNSKVQFTNNSGASSGGGAMYIEDKSVITIKDNCRVTLSDNIASGDGGAIYIRDNSKIVFQGNSKTEFNNNGGNGRGGAMYFDTLSNITFTSNSEVRFHSNLANIDGGAMHAYNHSVIAFTGKSTVIFHSNMATNNCGAMCIKDNSTVRFEGYSNTTFINNHGDNSGALYNMNSTVVFKANSIASFIDNYAISDNGGAIYTFFYSTIIFKDNSTVRFHNNHVSSSGGGMYAYIYSNVIFEGNSSVTFHNNSADGYGAAAYIDNNSVAVFKGNCAVIFHYNEADENGGALYTDHNSAIKFQENSVTLFDSNFAEDDGGAVSVDHGSTVNLEGKSTVKFYNNKVYSNGGAVYIDHCSVAYFKGTATVAFQKNRANLGGSIFTKDSRINLGGNCSVKFINSTASQDGGGMYLSRSSYIGHFNNASVTFNYNIAKDYGGAIYVLFNKTVINFNSSNIYFKGNNAGTVHKSIYINVLQMCSSDCHVNIPSKRDFPIATSPSKLILNNPAKCINVNGTDCDTYYINNIMLGQEITFDACTLDYYDQSTKATEFSVTGSPHQDYKITGPKYITILCNHTTQGISIVGNQSHNSSYNYSIFISLYVVRVSESKRISINVITELSQCHPGFWYSSDSQKCVCYNTKSIISCSSNSNSSTIKRGYWFGSVAGKPTVALCPDNYCNFTCCEIANGIYHLSPVRADQCRPHRYGIACSKCETGYTLPFDSSECVKENECTIGQAILVTTLSLLYWIVVTVTVFTFMYFKATIGSLYGIIYYYSVVDILLGQVLFISKGSYATINIMSSLAKLIPQFLGQLCLTRNMSGIDQQFIHFLHPIAVFLILIMISVSARKSRKISSFISRGIIPFICVVLLQSYTSLATTSLLLMRPLIFTNVNKIYTYLSPDIEYFQGRHLVYFIVAVLFTAVIVIGFPLLLLLEPFLNSKINFVKIKPLLDQFQYCYKDKYRCFAGYYMICRLVIILLTIMRYFDEFTSQYMLISLCALMQLIHVLVRPYVSTIHNVFDGIILQLIVIISALPIVEFVDHYDKTLVVVIVYVLVLWPMASFVSIKIWINKKNIQDTIKSLSKKCSNKYNALHSNDIEEPARSVNEAGIVVDDNMRRNAIIVDV